MHGLYLLYIYIQNDESKPALKRIILQLSIVIHWKTAMKASVKVSKLLLGWSGALIQAGEYTKTNNFKW